LPYISKSERDAASKMTRTQLLNHIRAADHCNEQEALRQMAKAICDGVLLVRWDDARPPPSAGPGPSPMMELLDRPPTAMDYWLNAKVDPSDADRIHAAAPYDPWPDRQQDGQLRFPWRFRRPLFDRLAVLQLWPFGPAKVVPLVFRKTGPKTGKVSSIVDAMKSDIQCGLLPDQLRQMSDKDLASKYGDKFGAKRTACREARDRAVSEIDGNSNPVK
jgi:hypothetical protein